MKFKVALIAAYSEKSRLIGDGKRLLWNIKEDKARFKELTMSGAVLMGRRTYESIGHPLEGRLNLVLTRSETFLHNSFVESNSSWKKPIFVSSFEKAFHAADFFGVKNIFISGGEAVYREALMMKELSVMYLTLVKEEKLISKIPLNKGVFFPSFRKEDWEEREREVKEGFTFLTLFRKKLAV